MTGSGSSQSRARGGASAPRGTPSCLISQRASCGERKRDPRAQAIVDGDVRLTYKEWYAKISSVVAAFDDLGLKPGDHLLTVLQNRWEAATIHWACQFAGIDHAAKLARQTGRDRFLRRQCRGPGHRLSGRFSSSGNWSERGREFTSDRSRGFRRRGSRLCEPGDDESRRRNAARQRGGVVADALHLGHDLRSQGCAAAASGRAGRGGCSCGAEPLPARRAHARRDATVPHHGGSLAASDVARRRHVRLSAAVRCRKSA